jgi:hypothetical protein
VRVRVNARHQFDAVGFLYTHGSGKSDLPTDWKPIGLRTGILGFVLAAKERSAISL